MNAPRMPRGTGVGGDVPAGHGLGAFLRARLARVTTSGSVIPVIDGLRFIAILGVVLYHGYLYAAEVAPAVTESALAPLLGVGWFGVELFFVISGFILAKGFIGQYVDASRPVSLPAYYLRRLTRLEPPYIIALLAYFTCKTVLFHVQGLGPNLLASLFYVHNIVYGEGSRVLGVAWSLEVEVQFYLLVPLLAQLFRIRPTWARRGVLVALIAGTQSLALAMDLHAQNVFEFLHLFLTGFLLCDLYWVDWKQGTAIPRSIRWDAVGALAWLALWLVLRHWVGWRPWIPLILLLAYVGAFRGALTSRLLSIPLVFTIGGMCYTIYLYHTLVLRGLVLELPPARWVLEHAGPTWGCVIVLFVSTCVLVAIAAVLFVLFEKPFMRRDWPRRVLARLSQERKRFVRRRLASEAD